MKFIQESEKSKTIEVGDIVEYEGEIGIVVYINKTYICASPIEQQTLKFPYLIVSLSTGLELISFINLEVLNNSPLGVALVSRNKDVTLSY